MKQKLLQLRNLVDECLLEIDKITNESSQHDNPVIRFVCKKHVLSVDSLIHGRAYHIVRARREAIYIMWKLDEAFDIAKIFGMSSQGISNCLATVFNDLDSNVKAGIMDEYYAANHTS